IVSGTAGLALALASGTRTDGAPAPKAVLKISSQEGRIPGRDLSEKLDRMEKWGIVGLEPGGGGLPGRVESLQRALSGRKVKISAICAGYSGCLISHEESERKKAMDSIKEILTAAGALGSTGLIVVPAFNGQTNLGHREARAILIDELKELGEHAHRHGTRVLLEPLNRSEAFFLRLLADAAAICRDVNSPGVGMMGDFYHMAIEETSDMGAFLSAGKYLHHVHLASRRRNLPGQDDRDFTDGFRGLKMIGYQDYCSFECGCIGDPEVEIPKSVKFLQEQWAKA
ncbi:MAG: sugar phosphate isomerase/epimerase family protein, partial [Armatimonadota bacterium]